MGLGGTRVFCAALLDVLVKVGAMSCGLVLGGGVARGVRELAKRLDRPVLVSRIVTRAPGRPASAKRHLPHAQDRARKRRQRGHANGMS